MEIVDWNLKQNSIKLVYTVALRERSTAGVCHPIPGELRWKYQSCRAVAKVMTSITNTKWWRYKPSVPTILMGNVNALENKVDELASLMKTQKLYRESSFDLLTETWLPRCIPDADMELLHL